MLVALPIVRVVAALPVQCHERFSPIGGWRIPKNSDSVKGILTFWPPQSDRYWDVILDRFWIDFWIDFGSIFGPQNGRQNCKNIDFVSTKRITTSIFNEKSRDICEGFCKKLDFFH